MLENNDTLIWYNENAKEITHMANKAMNFRLYPAAEQQVLFAGTFGCVRFVYNFFPGIRIRQYEKDGCRL